MNNYGFEIPGKSEGGGMGEGEKKQTKWFLVEPGNFTGSKSQNKIK